MRLYKRNFSIITDAERNLWDKIKEKEKIIISGKPSDTIRKSLYAEYSVAIRHFLSLFPNNHLDSMELSRESGTLKKKLVEFSAFLDCSMITERDILNFIEEHEAYFLIGAILKNNYQFGHHALYVFPEFKLPPNFQTDYLIVGKNSDGYHFVFVEFESPYGKITLTDGSYGEVIRKGMKQIEDWEFWLEQNFSHLKLVFEQSQNTNQPLPKEFTSLDKTRIHFIIIAGRRKDYNYKTYRSRRSYLEQRKLQIFHYDNLIDFANEAIGTHSY